MVGVWGGFSFYIYVLLKEGIDVENFVVKLLSVVENYVVVIFD